VNFILINKCHVSDLPLQVRCDLPTERSTNIFSKWISQASVIDVSLKSCLSQIYEYNTLFMDTHNVYPYHVMTKQQTQLLFMQYTIARKFYLDKSIEQRLEWNTFMFGTTAPHFPFFTNNDIDYNYFSYNGTVFNMK